MKLAMKNIPFDSAAFFIWENLNSVRSKGERVILGTSEELVWLYFRNVFCRYARTDFPNNISMIA